MTRWQMMFSCGVAVAGLMAGVCIPSFARAAEAVTYQPSCDPVYEEIVPLRVPDFEQSALWIKTVGVDGIDRPRALMEVADGGMISIGDSRLYAKPDDEEKDAELGADKIQMVRQDQTGKITVKAYIEVQHLDHVADALLKDTSVVVLTDLYTKDDGDFGLVFLNGEGEKVGEKVVHDETSNLSPKSLSLLTTKDPYGVGYAVLAEAFKRYDPTKKPYTSVLWLDGASIVKRVREYLPGTETQPQSMSRMANGDFLIAGRIKVESGADAGWLLRISSAGDLVFQHPYSRGAQATLRYAAGTADGGIVAVGDAIPAGQGDKAAWILKTDANGKVIWQKYLTGKYAYTAVNVVVLDDGRIETVWAASPTSHGGRRFARIVTLSNEGSLLGDESYIEGSNAIPFRLVSIGDKRVLLGMAETGFAAEKREDELQYVTYDTWIMALPPLAKFDDKCVPAAAKKLDDLPR